MKKLMILLCMFLTACVAAPPSQPKAIFSFPIPREETSSSSIAINDIVPHLPESWQFHRCPDQDPVKGCALEFPGPRNHWDFELQSDNAILLLGSSDSFIVKIDGNYMKKFTADEIVKCEEYKIMQGTCDRFLRSDIHHNSVEIISLGDASEKKTFIYYIFTPTQTYFINGTADDGDPILLDTSILNVRIASETSSSD